MCGGGCSFAERSVCLLAEVSVCLSQGSRLSLAPTPALCFGGSWLWAHPAVLCADAADVAGAPAVPASRRGGGGCNLLPG